MSRLILVVTLALLTTGYLFSDQRRIGKRHDLSWNSYYQLGTNYGSYEASETYPDLSVVGALISDSGALGTATLIAPNYVVTAAHVIKNDYYEIPQAGNWKFIMYYDFGDATSSNVYQVESLVVHPAWTSRQTTSNTLGDGDELGVDLALARLARPVTGVYPARLPSTSDDPLGERAILAGFGTLVEGDTGSTDSSNERRVGGENIIDRSVAKVSKAGVPESQRGGLLGVDFDSSQNQHNNLRSGINIDLLGSGDSQATPLSLEASTAVGDSGGPAFVRTEGAWRVHGVVSYGTTDSSYGDVTVYTRLASHADWLQQQLPDWPDSRQLTQSNWLENPWLGIFSPVSNGWNYHVQLGWLYLPSTKGNSFWAWSNLINKWIWLSDQAYPFVYCYNQPSSFWMYLLLESSDGAYIRAYDYSSGIWGTYSGGGS